MKFNAIMCLLFLVSVSQFGLIKCATQCYQCTNCQSPFTPSSATIQTCPDSTYECATFNYANFGPTGITTYSNKFCNPANFCISGSTATGMVYKECCKTNLCNNQ